MLSPNATSGIMAIKIKIFIYYCETIFTLEYNSKLQQKVFIQKQKFLTITTKKSVNSEIFNQYLKILFILAFRVKHLC